MEKKREKAKERKSPLFLPLFFFLFFLEREHNILLLLIALEPQYVKYRRRIRSKRGDIFP